MRTKRAKKQEPQEAKTWPVPDADLVYPDEGSIKQRFVPNEDSEAEITVLQIGENAWIGAWRYTHEHGGEAQPLRAGTCGIHDMQEDAEKAAKLEMWRDIAGGPAVRSRNALLNWAAHGIVPAPQLDDIDDIDAADANPAPEPVPDEDMTSELAEIPVERIESSPYQTRKNMRDIEELAASIRVHGIICPVAVRRMPGWHYQLVAGHRRVEAAKLAGIERIPAIVMHGCTDSDAAEMCVTENMQRCDLTPLEEAQGVKALLDTGHTAQDVADRLGRSRQWVARRANLLNLCDDVREAVSNPSDPMSLAPVAGLEMIAAMPEDTQRELLNAFGNGSGFQPTLVNIECVIVEGMCDLDTAPFDIVQCEHCLKRTSVQPNLFDIDEKASFGRCLDTKCFAEKRAEKLKSRIAEFRKEEQDAVIISDDWNIRKDHGLAASYDFKPAKKGEEGAIRAFKVAPNASFERVWVKPYETNASAESKPTQPTPEQKAKAKVCRYVAHLLDNTMSVEGSHPFAGRPEDETMRIMLVTGTIYPVDFAKPDAWDDVFLRMPFGDVEDALWAVVKPVLSRRVKYNVISRCDNAFQEALAIAKHVFGITAEAVCEQAAAWNEK